MSTTVCHTGAIDVGSGAAVSAIGATYPVRLYACLFVGLVDGFH